ncbi:MAG: sugar transferase [Candidatus Omnitrophica bacterium]|nr:sugar transferase [Candidatus Omnitrophota bacterium]
MLKEHSSFFRRMMIAVDLILLAWCFYAGYLFRHNIEPIFPFRYYLTLLPIFVAILGISFYILGLYRSFRTSKSLSLILIIFQSLCIGFIAFSSVIYILKIEHVSRSFVFFVFATAGLVISAEKYVLVSFFRHIRDKGYNFRNILIIGSGEKTRKFIKLVNYHREWGLNIIGVISDKEDDMVKDIEHKPVLGDLKQINHVVREYVVDEIVLFVSADMVDKIRDILLSCETEGIKVNVAFDFYEPTHFKTKLNELKQYQLITYERTPGNISHLMFKRILDVFISVSLLVLLFPFLAAVWLLVRLTSQGPAIFRQQRCGMNGRKFYLYKFRTMVQDADFLKERLSKMNEMEGPAFKMQNDPRVTKIGKILRKTSIDELPQLWNVLKGDMSLVGPRPSLPDEVLQYESWHRLRIRMRPGLTCLWQVNGRNKISNFNQWANLDAEYIDNWSLWLDLKILAKTIPVVLLGKGAE